MGICSVRNTGNPGEYDNVSVADDNGIRNRHICSERRKKKRGVISFVHKGRWRPSAVISISREEDKHLKQLGKFGNYGNHGNYGTCGTMAPIYHLKPPDKFGKSV